MKDKTVLLVEDERNLRQLMKTYFEKEGAKVLETDDGIEGVTIFSEHEVDLIILDIMLARSDGWALARNVRKDSNVPIIMVTARGEESDKLFGFEMGADDYVTKPFSLKELMARSHALLRRTNQHKNQDEVLIAGMIKIECSAHRAYLDDVELALSPKEYDMLVYFMQNKDLALSREMLLNGVWGYDYYGDLRTVDTHVKRLRQKLLPLDLIKTVHGYGYRFEV